MLVVSSYTFQANITPPSPCAHYKQAEQNRYLYLRTAKDVVFSVYVRTSTHKRTRYGKFRQISFIAILYLVNFFSCVFPVIGASNLWCVYGKSPECPGGGYAAWNPMLSMLEHLIVSNWIWACWICEFHGIGKSNRRLWLGRLIKNVGLNIKKFLSLIKS